MIILDKRKAPCGALQNVRYQQRVRKGFAKRSDSNPLPGVIVSVKKCDYSAGADTETFCARVMRLNPDQCNRNEIKFHSCFSSRFIS